MVRLVALDLDGTLLDPDGKVTDRAASAVGDARSAGIHVVPVTGRRPQSTWDVAETAGLGPFGVCANGAIVIELEPARRVLQTHALPAAVTRDAVELVRREVPRAALAAFTLRRLVYEPDFFDGPLLFEQSADAVADLTDALGAGAALGGGCVKLMARVRGGSAAAMLDALAGGSGDEMDVTSSGPDSVDIGAPGISKASGLAGVCDRLGVGVGDTLAVGDNFNDLSVLGWAGHAMAPANAIPEVLGIVERVLPTNGEDGVAQLLEELVAGRR